MFSNHHSPADKRRRDCRRLVRFRYPCPIGQQRQLRYTERRSCARDRGPEVDTAPQVPCLPSGGQYYLSRDPVVDLLSLAVTVTRRSPAPNLRNRRECARLALPDSSSGEPRCVEGEAPRGGRGIASERPLTPFTRCRSTLERRSLCCAGVSIPADYGL